MANPVTSIIITAEDQTAGAFESVDTRAERTAGQLEQLAAEAAKLAQGAGTAAPELQQLADSFTTLADQQRLIAQFRGAREALEESAAALAQAQEKAQSLGKSLAESGIEGDALKARMAGVSRAVHQAKEAFQEKVLELQRVRGQLSAVGVASTEVADAQREINRALSEGGGKIEGAAQRIAQMQEQAAAAARAHADEEDRLASIIEETRQRMAAAAQQQLQAENAAFAESQQRMQAYAAQTEAINRRIETSIKDAFAGVGVRSSRELQDEIRKINADLQRLAVSNEVTAGDFDRAWKAGQARIKALENELNGVVETSSKIPTALKPVAAALTGMFAVSSLKNAASSVIEVADAYGQYASRIEHATESAAEYDLVQRRLLETAGNTYRPLAEAQELYISTADSLRNLGYNTEQALDVTDSLSYLLVTNAASADKASSAISAYSKALQSGKLDVDGWMSIMSATPTIVEDIAAATGKTTEEIRRLGATGKLAIEDLNEGLRQSVEKNKEIADSMPTTVGDAIQKLANNWSAYIGEANRAHGVTDKLSGMIVMLADNLNEVVDTAVSAGEFVVAMFGVRAVGALQAYTAQLVAATGATTALSAASTAAGAAISRMSGFLRAAGYAAIALELYDIAKAWMAIRDEENKQAAAAKNLAANQATLSERLAEISQETGVLVTSMADLNEAERQGKVHFDKLTASWKAGPAPLKELTLETERLGNAAAAMVAQFDELLNAEKNGGMEGAIAGLVKQFDGDSVAKVQGFIKALDELQRVGTLSAQQVQRTWEQAIASLNGDGLLSLVHNLRLVGEGGKQVEVAFDALIKRLGQLSPEQLQSFSAEARKAFDESRISAEKFAEANEKSLLASLDKLGVNGSVALGRVSEETRGAVQSLLNVENALDASGASAETTARTLEMSLLAALKKVQGSDDLTEIERQLQRLEASSKLGASGVSRLGDEIAAVRRRLDDAAPGINSVEEAFRNLGIRPSAELKKLAATAKESFDKIRASGTASPREIQDAFKAYAKVAIEANDGVADSSLKVQAKQAGLRIETDNTGKSVVKSAAEMKQGFSEVGDGAEETGDRVGDLKDTTEETGNEVKNLGGTADEAGDSMDGAADSAQNLGGAAKWMAEAFERGYERIGRFSEAAEQAARAAAKDANSLAEVAANIGELSKSAAAFVDGGSFSKLSAEVREFEEAARQADDEARKLRDQLETGLGSNMRPFYQALAAMSDFEASLARASAAAARTEIAMSRLDRELEKLGSNGAKGLDDLRLRLLELNGTEEEIARARAARERAELEMEQKKLQIELKKAQLEGDKDKIDLIRSEIKAYDEMLVMLGRVHEAEKNARARARKEQAEEERQQRNEERRRAREEAASAEGTTDAAPVTPAPTPAPAVTHVVELRQPDAAPARIAVQSTRDVNTLTAFLREMNTARSRTA